MNKINLENNSQPILLINEIHPEIEEKQIINENKIEKINVIQVYDQIANDFSDTRRCVWTMVKEFLIQKKITQIGLEIGCGNGKNLEYGKKKNKFIIGIDNCDKLLKICKNKNLKVFKSDCCHLPFLSNSMDYVFSIAVFHHLATEERRIMAFKEMIRVLKPGKEGLISLWSVGNQRKKKFNAGNNFVKWERKGDKKKFQRFYYIFTKKMVNEYIKSVNELIEILDVYNEMGNWVIWFKKL